VGSAFAFALGPTLKSHENYQTFVTEEGGTLITQDEKLSTMNNNISKDTSLIVEENQMTRN
jgi:hypothetical protein